MIDSSKILVLARSLGVMVGDADCPASSRAALSSMIGIITVFIPDDLWERIMEESAEPCGRPMCNCHETTGKLFPVLDILRTESKITRDCAMRGAEL